MSSQTTKNLQCIPNDKNIINKKKKINIQQIIKKNHFYLKKKRLEGRVGRPWTNGGGQTNLWPPPIWLSHLYLPQFYLFIYFYLINKILDYFCLFVG
jgi:hypothetical protein